MTFTETGVRDAYVIDLKRIQDDRGFFARAWCRKELQEVGLNADVVQANVGFSRRKGTLRGLHFQLAPHAEAKFVRCTRGAIYDVVLDLRPESPTFRRWTAVELSADNERALYVPEGCAQGYQTLVDQTEMMYLTTHEFVPASARGVRYDDSAFEVVWPLPVEAISDADRNWPHFHL